MTSIKITNVLKQVEDWRLEDLERLGSELEDLISTVEGFTCDHCGNQPETGACYYCKQD